jgi:hypothetical protein
MDNPWRAMEQLKGVPARTQRWTEKQVDAVCAKVAEMGASSDARDDGQRLK